MYKTYFTSYKLHKTEYFSYNLTLIFCFVFNFSQKLNALGCTQKKRAA